MYHHCCWELVGLTFSARITNAYHDVSIANVSKPRRQVRHLLEALSADLCKVAAGVAENNIGEMLDIKPGNRGEKDRTRTGRGSPQSMP